MFNRFARMITRGLSSGKGYGFLNVFGLAIAIACAALIFLWVEDELLFDSNHEKKDRLYSVKTTRSFGETVLTIGSTPTPMAAALKAEIPGIENAARVSDSEQRLLLNVDDKSMYGTGRYVDSTIFSMFTIRFLQGSATSAFSQKYSLVITRKAAMKFFGTDRDIIGKSVRVNNEQDYLVSAIVEQPPSNATLQFEWLAPYEIQLAKQNAELTWDSYGPDTYVELHKSADLFSVNQRLEHFISGKNTSQKARSFLFPMDQWRLYSQFENGKQTGGGRIEQVRMLTTIAWIILLIGCINFMNLATASSQKRIKEVGVHKVLGADKETLIFRYFRESLIMATGAGLIAIAVAGLALPAFNTLMQKQLQLQILNPVHLAALLVIILLCSFVAGLYPAIYLASFKPISILKGLKQKNVSANAIRKGLVVFQFAVSTVFIISTIIVYLQIQHVKNRNLGFNKKYLLELNLQHDIARSFPVIKQQLLNTGIVSQVALADHPIIAGGNTDSRFEWQAKEPGNKISVAYRNVSHDFVNTTGLKLIEGRQFKQGDNASRIIVNTAMAKLLGDGPAAGRIIRSSRGNKNDSLTDRQVVGVVDDYVFGNAYGTPPPVILFCIEDQKANLVYVRTKNDNVQLALSKIEQVLKSANPAYPFEYSFVDDQFDKLYMNETLISQVSTVFALLAIFISCFGLFGLAAFSAGQRKKEVGIRKVLGANVVRLASLLSKDFLRLVGIACLIAFPVGWWMMNAWLENYQYRITISWWIFPAVYFAAITIAACTIGYHTIRTAIANPVNSLRSE